MCLVKLKPDREEEVVVAARPVSYVRPVSQNRRSIVQVVEAPNAPRLSIASNPRTSQTSQQPQLEPPQRGQLIVIEHRTPRTSGLSIVEGSYQYGNGPVGVGRRKSQRGASFGSQEHVHRRSGSLIPPVSPRQSNVSHRSTRERVVIVDELGTRREYYR